MDGCSETPPNNDSLALCKDRSDHRDGDQNGDCLEPPDVVRHQDDDCYFKDWNYDKDDSENECH